MKDEPSEEEEEERITHRRSRKTEGSQTDHYWLFQPLDDIDDPFLTQDDMPQEEATSTNPTEFAFTEPPRAPIKSDSQPLWDYLTQLPEGVADM